MLAVVLMELLFLTHFLSNSFTVFRRRTLHSTHECALACGSLAKIKSIVAPLARDSATNGMISKMMQSPSYCSVERDKHHPARDALSGVGFPSVMQRSRKPDHLICFATK